MIVTELALEDFRSAKRIALREELQLDSRLNIFYGDNGAGKSTLLDALSILLSWVPAKMKALGSKGLSISDVDIRNNEFFSALSIVTSCAGVEFAWSCRQGRKGFALVTAKSDYSGASEVAKMFASTGDFRQGLPILVAYPVTRVVLDIPLKIRTRHQFEAFNAYDESFSGAANFRVFFEWFRNREDIENQSARDNAGVIRTDRQLDAVRRAIEAFLPGINGLRIMREPSLRMQAMKHGRPYYVDQLSDGEKCLLALIGDLARRLAIANSANDNDPLKGDGIVLIDEIDLHLHPSWQRDIVPRLLKTFPNCQFFLTTHSPLVLNNVQPHNLFLVSNDQGCMTVSRPRSSFGKSVVRVLEDVMGLETTIPEPINSLLKSVFSYISGNNLEKAREGITSLRKLGYDDPELNRAEALIRRREVINK